MAGAESVRRALWTYWGLCPDECTPLWDDPDGGRRWLVDRAGERFLAKVVPVRRRPLLSAGIAVAQRLVDQGLVAGAPVRAGDGASVVALDDHEVLALVRLVEGRPLDPDCPVDQQWWGDGLARMHRGLAGFDHGGLDRFGDLRPDGAHLREPWLRAAVTDAVAAMNRLCVTDQLTYGVLLGQPAADAFRMDPGTGRVGLVDCPAPMTGPLAYDLAGAVMLTGGTDAAGTDVCGLVEGYACGGPVPREELEAALPTMLRFRWAVRADRLAARVAAGSHAEVSDLHGAGRALVDLAAASPSPGAG